MPFSSRAKRHRSLIPRRRLGACCVAALFFALSLPGVLSAQVIYTFEDVPASPIAIPNDDSTLTTNNVCGGTGGINGVVRTFTVPATPAFNVGGSGTIALGLDIEHLRRQDLQVRLEAPNGNTLLLANSSTSGNEDHYQVTFAANADAGNVLDDGDVDPLSVAGGSVRYRRLVDVAGVEHFLCRARSRYMDASHLRRPRRHRNERGFL